MGKNSIFRKYFGFLDFKKKIDDMAISPPCQQSTWHGNIPLERSSQTWEL